jgi:hypothetical protein
MAYDAAGRRVSKAINGTGIMDATTHYYLSGKSVQGGPGRGAGGAVQACGSSLTIDGARPKCPD